MYFVLNLLVEISTGTDDDNPQPLYNRGPVGGRVAGNGRSFVGAPFQRIQMDMEFEIHNLEQIAYGAVLRAFKAQSDALTWVYSVTYLFLMLFNFVFLMFGEIVCH